MNEFFLQDFYDKKNRFIINYDSKKIIHNGKTFSIKISANENILADFLLHKIIYQLPDIMDKNFLFLENNDRYRKYRPFIIRSINENCYYFVSMRNELTSSTYINKFTIDDISYMKNNEAEIDDFESYYKIRLANFKFKILKNKDDMKNFAKFMNIPLPKIKEKENSN